MAKELWEQPFDAYSNQREVKPRRKKRLTKSELAQCLEKGGNSMSPVLDTEVREGADDVVEGVAYEIINVEDVDTEVQGYKGIRVSLLTEKAIEGNVMLWKRKVTGTGSKLGVFITVLGNNTDKWMHKWVKMVSWQDRKRELEVVSAPSPKASKKPVKSTGKSKKS